MSMKRTCLNCGKTISIRKRMDVFCDARCAGVYQRMQQKAEARAQAAHPLGSGPYGGDAMHTQAAQHAPSLRDFPGRLNRGAR